MDPKGDDSGSDTLDQSLQKKCVVADDDSFSKQPDAAASEENVAKEPTTEPGGNNAEIKDSPASPSPPPPPTDNNTTDVQCIVVNDNWKNCNDVADSPASPPSSVGNHISDGICSVVKKDVADSPLSPSPLMENCTPNAVCIDVKDNELPDENTSNNGKDDSRGFESKVRQISDDLKDTSLADENSLEKVEIKQEIETASETASAVTLEDIKNDSDGYDSDKTVTYDSPSKKSSSPTSEMKIKKKVRFKVIDSDGCKNKNEPSSNVEGKKKVKKNSGRNKSEKSVRNIVLRIPLSFASPQDEEDDELIDEKSAQSVEDDQKEEDDPPPEGGVKQIAGKVSQMGKIEYLLRWMDKPGLHWESEEVLNELCPNLLKKYEDKRTRERAQDMSFVLNRKRAYHDHTIVPESSS